MGKKVKQFIKGAAITASMFSAVMGTGSTNVTKQSKNAAKHLGTSTSQSQRRDRGTVARGAVTERNTRRGNGKKR